MEKMSKIKSLTIVLFLFIFAFAGIVHADDSSKIDLNKATVQELVKLKGIGKKYAELIIEYREKNGNFKNIEEIMKVKGIGQKKFESIKDLIFVKTDE